MATYKPDRTAEDIKRELTAIIRELKDPRVAGHIISLPRIDAASDLSYVKVYVSTLEGMDASKNAVKALTGAAGLVRRELGMRLHLRKTPELKFIADNSIERGMDIARALENLVNGEGSNEN